VLCWALVPAPAAVPAAPAAPAAREVPVAPAAPAVPAGAAAPVAPVAVVVPERALLVALGLVVECVVCARAAAWVPEPRDCCDGELPELRSTTSTTATATNPSIAATSAHWRDRAPSSGVVRTAASRGRGG